MERLRIPELLLEKLREVRAFQLKYGDPEEVIRREEAIILRWVSNFTSYLCFDGRVLIWEAEDRPREANDLGEIAAQIVIGADNIELPELLSLLPPQPDDGMKCPSCSGERLASWCVAMHGGRGGHIICPTCRGLGWVP